MKRRKLLSWILTACLVFTALPLSAVCVSAVEIIVDTSGDPDSPVVVEIPDDPDPTIVVDLTDDPANPPMVVINVNMTGAGTQADPFVVYTPKGLEIIRSWVEQGNSLSGYYFALGSDVDLSGVCSIDAGDWGPIGNQSHPFAGTFDGRGHTISGLYIGTQGTNNGLFGVMSGTVKNMTLNGRIATGDDTGGFAGENRGRIENCVFKGMITGGGTSYTNVGGIAGLNKGTITGCSHEGEIHAFAVSRIGGIAGTTKDGSIENCVNKGFVGSPMSDAQENCGGIAGFYESGGLSDCRNEGQVQGSSNVGGIVGRMAERRTLSGFANTGSVTGNYDNVGGIIGYVDYYTSVTDCRNTGSVKGSNAGGIAGFSKAGTISGCVNTGSLTNGQSLNGAVGGIVGYADVNTVISYCSNSGVIQADADDSRYGGIVGHLDNAKVHYCYNLGEVSCRSEAGGIIGHAWYSEVKCCFNTGYVHADNGILGTGSCFGGVAGYTSSVSYYDCYNTGTVIGNKNAGGILGHAYKGLTLQNCVSTGSVQGTSNPGLLIGSREVSGATSALTRNYYWDEHNTGLEGIGDWHDNELAAAEVLEITESQYTSSPSGEVYKDWDFTNTWYMTDGGPRLRNTVYGVDNGIVTISSLEDLRLFRDNCNAGLGYKDVTVKLTVNLDLSKETNWEPIGYGRVNKDAVFSGTFDGGGHTISGLKINTSRDYAGFFGRVDGTVKDLTVIGEVNGTNECGGIAGTLLGGTVSNCYFAGSVKGDHRVGGIAGTMDNGSTVCGCMFRGSVTGEDDDDNEGYCRVGGIAGEALSGCVIETCAAEAAVEGCTAVGGIVGYGSGVTVQNCLHTGDVTSNSNAVGGVAGYVMYSIYATGSVQNCYHYSGTVESDSDYLTGGVIGQLVKVVGYTGSGAEHCYYLKGTVKPNSSTKDYGIGPDPSSSLVGQNANPAGVAEPLTAEKFKAERSFDSWNFTDVWIMNAERPLLRGTGTKDISNAVITLGTQEVYDGTEKSAVIDSVTLNGVELSDYEITSGGTATVVEETTLTIAGTGFYTGEATAVWSLEKAAPQRSDFTFPAPGSANYNGSPVDASVPATSKTGMGAVSLRYSPDGHTDAGAYTVAFDVAEGANYKAASNIIIGTLTINKLENPATIADTAEVEAGGKTVDLSANVTDAEGTVTYAVSGEASGCSVDETTGAFTSGEYGGTVTVTVTVAGGTNYNDKEGTITVTVTGAPPKILTGLAVTAPTKTEYVHGDTLDAAGMTVTAEYNNGQTFEEVTEYTVSYASGGYLKKGDETVTVSYGGMTAEVTGLKVNAKELTVEGLMAISREEDGTTEVTLTGGTLKGVLDGEDVSAVIPSAGTVESPEAGTAKPVSFDAITLTGADAGSYTVTQPSVTVDITAKQAQNPDPGVDPDPPAEPKTVATPVLSEETQTFSGELEVTISCTTTGAAIYYTLDGSDPTAGSELYDGGIITVSKTATLKAIAILDGYTDSGIAEAVYTKKASSHSEKPPKNETETPAEPGVPDEPETPEEPFLFEDVPETAYFRKAVEWAVRTGVTGGTTPTTFSPEAEATRAQTVTFLWAASGCPEPETAENPFRDVSEGDYFYKAVLWAYENGITAGIGEGLFGSDETVTRGQVVTFLYNLAGRPKAGSEPFEDVDPEDYFQKAVSWAYGEGITSGTGAATFSPDADCLREQIITFMYQYFGEE